MKIATPLQMNEIDSFAINKVGIPGIVLMENAALRLLDEILADLRSIGGKKVVILAGKGNNGGDAFAAARHLVVRGYEIEVYVTAEKESITGDARINYDILTAMGIETLKLNSACQLGALGLSLGSADLIIDGIFGTGFKGKIEGIIADVIGLVNSSGKRVLSIDIPSGVNGETGKVGGGCIKADKTVTFALPKVGLVVHPGCDHTGELVIADIGIPPKAIESQNISMNIIEQACIRGVLGKRTANSNKGSYGKIFVVSGSPGMTGAGCLTAKAALRSGAGLAYIGVPAALSHVYDTAVIEAITVPFEDNGTGRFSKGCIPEIIARMEKMTALAVGPGMGVSDAVVEIVSNIISKAKMPVVLDADGLNALSADITILQKLQCKLVITPHPGEMARLSGISIEDVQNNRIEVAREFALKWKAITVLKGSRTVVACPDGSIYINTSGNAGMATAGTGDVLTGIIAGLMGQGANPEEAAIGGVFLHGHAGDLAAVDKGQHGLIAGDLVEYLPYAIKGVLGQ